MAISIYVSRSVEVVATVSRGWLNDALGWQMLVTLKASSRSNGPEKVTGNSPSPAGAVETSGSWGNVVTFNVLHRDIVVTAKANPL